jgi:cobalt/nickel transport system permease protein
MHIPDGFLTTPVWTALDAVALPAVAVIARKSQKTFEESKVPQLGVMGAFVFAAQIVNFPVGVGTSGHLVGGALLSIAMGPASATLVMTAILLVQAFVFQDGGILALGANVLNMAVFGVLAGYLPYRFFGATEYRKIAIFAAGFFSVLVSAGLALSELMASGVRMPSAVLTMSWALFVVSAALEGIITLAVVQSLERLNPRFIKQPAANRGLALAAVAGAAVFLVVAGVLFASTHPDGLEKLAENVGIANQAKELLKSPVSGYEWQAINSPWLRKSAAGLFGLTLIYAVCLVLANFLRGRSQPAVVPIKIAPPLPELE